MNYSVIRPYDIANGPGIRVSLFVSGCRNHCKGCFNPETWDFNYGQEFTWETLHEIEELLKSPHIAGLSILGGDPFEAENREWVETLCAYVKHNCPGKDIWVWTGYDFLTDGLIDLPVMKYINVLVDGRFEEDLKDLRLKWRGSSNQRVIDVKKSVPARCAFRYPFQEVT
jgi:anaerobic ribonucleoside-triphosphate reductase activating protein